MMDGLRPRPTPLPTPLSTGYSPTSLPLGTVPPSPLILGPDVFAELCQE